MAYNELETLLALQCLRAPLNENPVTDQERVMHELQIRYRTYLVEYNPREGAIKLPSLFVEDFGHEITRIAYLFDSLQNQFEVLVERVNGSLYFTRGWGALHDFYDVRDSGWVMLLYTGGGYFGVIMQDRVHKMMNPPTFVPPGRFAIDKTNVPPTFVDGLVESIPLLSYSHDQSYFQLSYQKALTYNDIYTGFLVLPYHGFGEHAFDEATTVIKLIDECGNEWDCDLIAVTFPYRFLSIGGGWSAMVALRRLCVGENIRVGVQEGGNSQALYITFI